MTAPQVPGAYTFTVYKDQKGEYRWRLVAPNNRIVADSAEGYNTRQGCEEGIRDVQRQAAQATVKFDA